MPDDSHLQDELAMLRQRVAELEAIEAEYQRAQAALKEVGGEWENLLEIVGDSVFIVDPVKMAILDANDHAARRLGYGREELLATPYSSIEIKQASGPAGAAEWESQKSRTRFYDCLHRHHDGTATPVEVSSRIIRHQGQPALLNFARDISLRKQEEAEREQMIVELEAYAHTVAHDLKNPVALMMGYSEMLGDDSYNYSREEIKEYLSVIHRAATKMHNIIDELLLLASVRKMDEVGIEPLDMQTIVSEALKRLENVIEPAGTVVHLPESWPLASGYAAWVEEVWVNDISNAIKYGGTPPQIELGATAQGGAITFWARDNGRGIAPEDQPQLFKQFTRFDQARAEGHGLGLSIVKSIVAKLGGEVGGMNRPEGGSEFFFTLPAAQ